MYPLKQGLKRKNHAARNMGTIGSLPMYPLKQGLKPYWNGDHFLPSLVFTHVSIKTRIETDI